MARWGYGLRAKAMLALLAACLLALVPVGLLGLQGIEAVRGHFGDAYARNFTERQAQGIRARVEREAALSRRLADSIVTERWLEKPDSGEARTDFFREAERYRHSFRDANYFLIHGDGRYFHNAADTEFSSEPRYRLSRDEADDAWFFNIMDGERDLVVNVNPDAELGVTRVWVNVVIRRNGEATGLAGTGLDLSRFLAEFVRADEAGVTPMIVDAAGAIQAHPDADRIAYGSAAGLESEGSLKAALGNESAALEQAMARADRDGFTPVFTATLDGRTQRLAVTAVPALDWYVISAVDLDAATVLEGPWLQSAVAAGGATLLVLLGGFAWGVDRLILRPLRSLQHSATALAEGDYRVALPEGRRDEIGDLGQAFGSMAEQVADHTSRLEEGVRQRTRELEAANRRIRDSINYAALIQRALLPDGRLTEALGPDHFILWHPRDGVGGDFYLFRSEAGGDRFLVGTVDCAGHGVPGALMTMLARAAFDEAMNTLGIESPAALLRRADATLRDMVRQSAMPETVATNLDAGLVFVDRTAGQLRFSGARIALHASDGTEVRELPAGRRALCDRRQGEYTDQSHPTDPRATYYLVTDGYLDQAGGDHGFGFGNTRFRELLRDHARRPMAEQAAALEEALASYRGDHEQRDDITVLAFRVT
jgi:serine phosphatase RsbU (regulator of sigma subunit)